MVQKRATSTEPSVRMLRMGEQVRHALAEVLQRGDVHDPALSAATISVTEVRMSPDLRHAMVFVKPLLGGNEKEILTALRKNVRYLRGEVSKRVQQKFACDLKFKVDESFDEGSHIDSLLRSDHVAQDLTGADEEE